MCLGSCYHGSWYWDPGVGGPGARVQEHGVQEQGVQEQGHELRHQGVRILGFLGVLELGFRRQGAWEPGFCPSWVQEQGL